MKEYTEKIVDHLSDILEKNIDAQKGFEKAVENTENGNLKSYFRDRSQERGQFVSDLRTELTQYGEKYKETGSAAASVHRGWMDFKSMFSGDDDRSMLEEAIRGEEKALKGYDRALKPGEVPETTATLLRRQRGTIESGPEKLWAMEGLH